MALEEYKRKRRFEDTPEPPPEVAKKKGNRFVVQKHEATRLHYDFRLEMEGVLRSWAVPRGPSLDPRVRRLAQPTEDHPLDYGDFEGIIPAGEYGGGTVVLWDHGSWEPEGDPALGWRTGKLKFRLHGEKLQGSFLLVRSGGRHDDSGSGKPAGWLLMKLRDEHARPAAEYDIT